MLKYSHFLRNQSLKSRSLEVSSYVRKAEKDKDRSSVLRESGSR